MHRTTNEMAEDKIMGQIANQMALELFFKEKKQEKSDKKEQEKECK